MSHHWIAPQKRKVVGRLWMNQRLASMRWPQKRHHSLVSHDPEQLYEIGPKRAVPMTTVAVQVQHPSMSPLSIELRLPLMARSTLSRPMGKTGKNRWRALPTLTT